MPARSLECLRCKYQRNLVEKVIGPDGHWVVSPPFHTCRTCFESGAYSRYLRLEQEHVHSKRQDLDWNYLHAYVVHPCPFYPLFGLTLNPTVVAILLLAGLEPR